MPNIFPFTDSQRNRIKTALKPPCKPYHPTRKENTTVSNLCQIKTMKKLSCAKVFNITFTFSSKSPIKSFLSLNMDDIFFKCVLHFCETPLLLEKLFSNKINAIFRCFIKNERKPPWSPLQLIVGPYINELFLIILPLPFFSKSNR